MNPIRQWWGWGTDTDHLILVFLIGLIIGVVFGGVYVAVVR